MRILHIPFCFHPDPMGGTEVYVLALARELSARNAESVIAAAGPASERYSYCEIGVRRFATQTGVKDLREMYGDGDVVAANEFGKVLDEEQPELVHLHAFTLATSLRFLREVKRRGIPLVYTYHTPTATCQRGSMMRWGAKPCDGLMDVRACSSCTLEGLLNAKSGPRGMVSAVVKLAAKCAGSLPPSVGRLLGKRGLRGGRWTALRTSELVKLRHDTTRAFLQQVDHIVAVCDWVKHVLLINGVREEKITLCRQGVMAEAKSESRTVDTTFFSSGVLRICLLGRFDSNKGFHVLLEAIRHLPEAALRLDIYGVGRPGHAYEQTLRRLAAGDERIQFRSPIPADAVISTLRNYDLVAVPSQWLETGPLVVLEAFAAGIPVIGAKLGGIAELVRDGVDGILVAPESSPAAWQGALQRLNSEAGLINRLRSGVTPPRTMKEVAADMEIIYGQILARTAVVSK
jgi:glycosyltransferase involved in cell wall biosynthesis